MRSLFLTALLFCSVIMIGQEAVFIPSLLEEDHRYSQSKEEQQLIAESREMVDYLKGSGYLIQDTTVTDYIRQILYKIRPAELSGYKNEVYLMRTPEINAFSLPDGSIVVCLGLLILMENEAQLAFILAHELAHFIERHGYKHEIFRSKFNARKLDKGSVKKAFSDLSVQNEMQADSLGLALFKKADYDPASASRSLDLLPREDTTLYGSFFARALLPELFAKKWPTHPRTDARVSYLSDIENKAGGFLGEEIYKSKTAHLWAYNIKLTKGEMNLLDYVAYLEEIRSNLSRSEYYDWLTYEMGVAYQELYCDPMKTGNLLAEAEKEKIHGKGVYLTTATKGYRTYESSKDFLESQAQQYFSEIEANPEFNWRINKNKGLICLQKKDYSCAREKLNKYINSGNPITDKRYVSSIIKEIDRINKK